MKIVSGILMFVLLGVVASAQEPRPAPKVYTTTTQNAKVIAEVAAANSDKVVKNAPFSAEAISESVQTLADGNRIVRSSTSKLYRNGEGRFRREMTGGTGGVMGSLYTYGHGISLLDPVGGYRYMIDPNLRTTRQAVISPRHDIRIVTGSGQSLQGVIAAGKLRGEIKAVDGTVVVSDKLNEEIKVITSTAPAIAAQAAVVAERAATLAAPVAVAGLAETGVYAVGGQHSKWETRTEELGTQNIEGVDAEGTRTITTIPADAIGNERPIEITYEKWYSKELQLVVMSKHNDPRFGEQTYRLTNIVRSEPDPSLFSLPTGYKLITEPTAGTAYTIATKAAYAEKTAAAQSAKSAQSSSTVTKTKP